MKPVETGEPMHSGEQSVQGERNGKSRFDSLLKSGFVWLSLLYAAVPSLLFCFNWLRWYYGIPVCLLIAGCLLLTGRRWGPIPVSYTHLTLPTTPYV
jgi:hypothetical protein